MTKTEEMVLKTVHDLGVASALDVQNHTGIPAGKATMVSDFLENKGYLKPAGKKRYREENEHDGNLIVLVYMSWKLTRKGKKTAKRIPNINEPLCIPITRAEFAARRKNDKVEKHEKRETDEEKEDLVRFILKRTGTCWDCKHYDREEGDCLIIKRWFGEDILGGHEPDDLCSKIERRENDENN